MQILLGTAVFLLALTAVGRLTSNLRLRRWMRGFLGRALPGACTGRPDAAPARGPREAFSRLQWTEVVNLTAADSVSRPRAKEPAREESPVPVESR